LMKFSGALVGSAHSFGVADGTAAGGTATSLSLAGAAADCIPTPSVN
jgi:hypothetical protein